MRGRLLALLVAGMLVAALPAVAQETSSEPAIADEIVEAFVGMARRNIGQARLSAGSYVPPETEAERARPLLPLAVAREVVRVAMFSATAAWCEVEWQESNYLRLMTAERGRDGWSDKQTAFIGLLHGTAMGTLERFYREESDCTADDGSAARETIDRYWLRRGEGGS